MINLIEKKMRQAVLNALKKVADLSDANIKNVDGLMSKKSVDQDVEWVGEKGKCVPENPYKMSY